MITQEKIELLKNVFGPSRIKEHAVFPFGNAEYEAELFAEVSTVSELVEIITVSRQNEIPMSILGIGFTPVDGQEIAGLVIKNNCRKFDMLSMKGVVTSGHTAREVGYVQAESGVSLNQLVRFTLDEGLGGLECFLGISGTVGDNIMRNTASGEEIGYLSENIYSIQIVTKENDMVEMPAEPFLFPLEENMIEKKQVIPLSVVFKLHPSDKSELWKKATDAAFKRNQSELLDPLKGNFSL